MSEKKRLNILVIDEDPLVLKSFVSLLNHEGYTAIGVSAVSRAIKLLENNPFDMVITELVMAEMSGEELLSAIIKRAPGIILIVLTIFGSLQMARLALRKGAFDYLLKPCDYKVLKESIDRAVTSQKISQGEKMAEEALRASEERYRIVIENVHDLLLLFNTCMNGADLAIGSRYKSGVNVINWPIGRVLMSSFASVYVRLVTGMKIYDTTAGFKCYKRHVLESMELEKIKFKGYAFQIEMKFTAWKLGHHIEEVPIVFTDRREGTSKMSGGIFNEALWGVLIMKLRSLFRGYYRKPEI